MPLGIILFALSLRQWGEKAQLLNPLMKNGHSRWICIWAISSVCVMYIFVGRVEWSTGSAATLLWYVPLNFRNCSVSLLVFPWVEAVMSLMSPILSLYRAVPRFFPFNLFIACIVSVAHNFVELQSEREWVENESVDNGFFQKTILEIRYCNQQYPLKFSSQTWYLFQENCQELTATGTYLLCISSITRS